MRENENRPSPEEPLRDSEESSVSEDINLLAIF